MNLRSQETGTLYNSADNPRLPSEQTNEELHVNALFACLAGKEVPQEIKAELKSRGYKSDI